MLPPLGFFKSCWPTALTAHTEPYCKSDSSTQSLPPSCASQCRLRKSLPSSWSCTQRHVRFEHAPDSSADYSLSVLRSGVGCDIPAHESDSPLLFLSDPSRSAQTDKRYPHEPDSSTVSSRSNRLPFPLNPRSSGNHARSHPSPRIFRSTYSSHPPSRDSCTQSELPLPSSPTEHRCPFDATSPLDLPTPPQSCPPEQSTLGP